MSYTVADQQRPESPTRLKHAAEKFLETSTWFRLSAPSSYGGPDVGFRRLSDTKNRRLLDLAMLSSVLTRRIRGRDGPLRTVHVVRVLELNRSGPAACDRHFLEHEREGVRLEDRKVAALFALSRCPAEQRGPSSLDDLLDVRIGPGLVELMVEGCHHVLPRSIEDRDSVGLPAACFGIHPDRVVDNPPANLD